jgi:hypothetical protein
MVGMKYGKLRIAWSAACGVVCVLLVALSKASKEKALGFNDPPERYRTRIRGGYERILLSVC